jgi:uncharacterized protein YdhG (YjbR/CyaY superfamily)
MRVFPKIGVDLVAAKYPTLAHKIKTRKDTLYKQINLVVSRARKTD